MSDLNAAKALVRDWWATIDSAPVGELAQKASQHLDGRFRWQGFAPFTETHGPEQFATTFLEPFRSAFPDYTRQIHLFCAGHSNGREDGTGDGALWVGATGYLVGSARAEFAGIPAHDKLLRLRWSEFYRIENGSIIQCQHLIDQIDWFEQIGRPVLPTPRGTPHVWPAPTGYDGDLARPQDAQTGVDTLEFGRVFIFGGLNLFDQSDLSSMGMGRFFHPNVKWYGPGGIGACLSLQEFTENHQEPWLIAFPDRQVQDLDNLFAEDRLLAGSSFPGVLATHSGPYQGEEPTGNRIAFNGIDFWLRDGDKFTENWVFVDFIHFFDQFGIDLMDRMRKAA
jgi:predicted ester cyclase